MNTSAPSYLIGSPSFFRVMHESLDKIEFRPELAALERLKKSMYNVANTLASSFMIGSSSFLLVMRTIITSRMSSKFGQI